MLFTKNITELYKNSVFSQFGENTPAPIEDTEEPNDSGASVPVDTSLMEECSTFMKQNFQQEKIDSDDGDIDMILDAWDDCDDNTLSRIRNFENTRGEDRESPIGEDRGNTRGEDRESPIGEDRENTRGEE